VASRSQTAGRASSRWRRRFLALAVLLAALVSLAPTIICRTPLAQALASYATASLEGEITFKRLSVGWLQPLELQDVAWVDAEGETLARVQRISGNRSLWAWLADRSNLGRIRLSKPEAFVVWSQTGSNWETSLAPFLQVEAGESPMAVNIEMEQGRATLFDRTMGKTVILSDIALSLEIPAAGRPISGKISAKVRSQTAPAGGDTQPPPGAGRLQGAFSWQSDAADAWGKGELALRSRQFPLAAVAPLLRRVDPDAALDGALTFETSGVWSSGAGKVEIVKCEARNVQLAAPAFVGKDRLFFTQLTAGGVCRKTAQSIDVSDLFLTADGADVQAAFSFPLNIGVQDKTTGDQSVDWQSVDWQSVDWLRVAEQVSGRLDMNCDIAALARQLPQLLRLRTGAEVTGGKLRLSLESGRREQTHVWRAEAAAANLTAMHDGKAVQWKRPFSFVASARRDGDTIAVETFKATADFLELEGGGRWNSGEIKLRGDLDKLVQQLGQFVELGDLRLRGITQGELTWKIDSAHRFTTTGDLSVVNFEYSTPNRRPWSEPQVRVQLAANGVASAAGLQSLESGILEINAGAESANIVLAAPVKGAPRLTLGDDTAWPLDLEMRGEVNRWLPRLEAFTPLPEWAADGGFSIKAKTSLSAKKANISSFTLKGQQLRIWGPGLFLEEPSLSLAGSSQCDWSASEWTSPEIVLTTNTLAARCENNRLNWSGAAPRGATQIAFRANLARAVRWLQDPRLPPTLRVEGQAIGALALQDKNDAPLLKWDVDIKDFVYAIGEESGGAQTVSNATAWTRIWREPQVQFQGEAAYAPQKNELQILKSIAATPAVQVRCQGRLTSLHETPTADLTGALEYDLEQLTPRLRPLIDENLELKGREITKFRLQGPLTIAAVSNQTTPNRATPPLVSPKLEFDGGLQWEFVRVLGVGIGAGAFDVQLRAGVARVRPMELAVGGGTLRVTPTLDLRQTPAVIRLAPGQVAEKLAIEPAMCRTWLKYVAPLLADATEAEGVFSLQLERAEFPCDDPQNGVVLGKLLVESARVSAGPLARQYIVLAQQLKGLSEGRPLGQPISTSQRDWIDLPKQEISLEIRQGRVYHQGVKIQIGDVQITTRGSVGFDQTVQLLAEIPLQDAWLKTDIARRALQGQVVRIPVGGSVLAPRLDGRAINNLASQAIGNAANNVLQDQINRGLDQGLKRLFGTPK